MNIKIFSVVRQSYGDPFEHSLSFMITKFGVGFVMSTPNYSTGMRLNPFSAMTAYIRFCCKRDEKSTWSEL